MMNPGDETPPTPPRDNSMRLTGVDTPPASPPLLSMVSPTDMWLSPDMGATCNFSPPSPSPAAGGDVLLGPPESLDISSDAPSRMRTPAPSFRAGILGPADLDLHRVLEPEDHHQLQQEDPQSQPRQSWAHHRPQKNKAAGTAAEKEQVGGRNWKVGDGWSGCFFLFFFSKFSLPWL